MRAALAVAILLLLPVACATAQSPAASGPRGERPNIILCMADDQGWGDTAYNGHPVLKTPHLDAMSRAGLRFDRFHAAAPVCTPTRASVLTGRHPNRTGALQWGHALRPQEETLAETLRSAGYATGHFGKWHLGSVRRGSPVNPAAQGFDRWLSAENFYDNDPVLSANGVATPLKGESSMVAADAAIAFMKEQAAAGTPFLAVIWFGSPHRPFRAAPEDRAHYAGRDDADWLGEITGLDRAVGRLRAALRELEIHERTIFWYCSDNGGLEKASSGGRGRKGSIYEGGLLVPAIIEWPGRVAPGRVAALPAGTCDIFPTVLEITGAAPGQAVPRDGVSLVPLIDGGPETPRPPIGFWSYPAPGVPMRSDRMMEAVRAAQSQGREPDDDDALRLDAAVIEGQRPEDSFPGHAAWLDWPWKLHRIQDAKTGEVRLELYHLGEDPLEADDRAGAETARAEALRGELESWLGSVARSLNGKDSSGDPSGP